MIRGTNAFLNCPVGSTKHLRPARMVQLAMVLTSLTKVKSRVLASLIKQGGQNQKYGLKYNFLKLLFFDLEE